MTDVYGLKNIKPSAKPLPQSSKPLPGLKTQQIYDTLYKKRNTKLNNFETFLKTKLETPASVSARSLKESPRIHSKPPQRQYRLPTDGPISLQTNLSARETTNMIQTCRTQRTQDFASFVESQKQQQTPTGVSLFFVKSARGNKTPIRLTETFVKAKLSRMNTLKRQNIVEVEETQDNKEEEDDRKLEDNQEGKLMLESKRNRAIRAEDTSIVAHDVKIENPQNTSNQESLYDQQVSSLPRTNCQSPATVVEGSITDRRGIKKVIRINIPVRTQSTDPTEEDYKINQQHSADPKRAATSLRKSRKVQTESAGVKNQVRPLLRMNSYVKSKYHDLSSGTSPSMTSFQRHFEDTQIKSVASIADRPGTVAKRENESPSATVLSLGGSQLISPKKKKEVSKKINDYIPEWLAARNDFTKGIENKEGNFRNLIIKICSKFPSDRNSEEIEIVARWLRKINIFKNLANQLLESIACNIKYRLYDKDEVLCFQGEPGDCLYIIYEGLVKCLVNRKEVAVFKTYDAAGQKALESSAPRTASLIAAVPTDVLRLEREEYCTIMEYYIRNTKSEHLALINQVNILKDLKESKKEVIISCLQSKHYSAGDVVYTEGEPVETFYILKSGKLQIEAYVDLERENFWPISNDSRERTKVARSMRFKHIINPNEYFGEMELINRTSGRVNSIVCLENSNILLMNKRDFNALFEYGDLVKFRNASQKHLLQDTEFMRKKLEEKEAEKRKLRNVMVSALKHHLARLDQSQPKGTSIETSINKVKQEFKQFMQENTVGKVSKKFDVIAIKSKD